MKDVKSHKNVDLADKAFNQSILVSVISILLCLIALCSVTYAWFAEDVTTANNKIEAGMFDLAVTVKAADGSEIPFTKGTDGIWRGTLPAADTPYTVTLAVTDTTNVRGFCLVANGETKWQTDAIEVGDASFTFTVTVTGADADITLAPQWGYPADPAITAGGTITIE